ncbi:hypothetical protein TG4357_02334 [Thalassovita gelatinovora]|uniref:Uncharacterized protein n=1 Tax=Thalassovita gelatinovora TaxID=53501 RepID=A0A0N7LVG9_THAGE|nr:hypothetical protein [Thalassovita gelatinovora]QIZ81447.1 hypothetical protein HFZ77_13660 [Thalassovita gelatinovora]CUH66266.1 hypothetical protein TG4357_02334 [Thalassovita gelatinovora]SEQ22602.1 hypothetical protein SAMN04488043_10465 [Thalassovita gelatinovora]
MPTFLSQEVLAGLHAARKRDRKRNSRMLVEADGKTYRVLSFWDSGFALDAETASHLRGFVDLFERGQHLYQCLIVAASEDDGRMCYEFKRLTAIQDRPPVDFVVEDTEGLALPRPSA